jgi:hypothetical protein
MLRRIHAYARKLLHGRLLLLEIFTTSFWHFDAVEGPSTPSFRILDHLHWFALHRLHGMAPGSAPHHFVLRCARDDIRVVTAAQSARP